MRHESANIRSAAEVLAKVEPDTEVVGIDEGQFFDNELVDVANELAGRGVRVIIAGLGPGLHRQTLGTDAATARHRRIHHQDSRHLHEVWPTGKLLATHL